MRKESVAIQFTVLTQHSPGVTEETMRCPVPEPWTSRTLPDTKQGRQPLDRIVFQDDQPKQLASRSLQLALLLHTARSAVRRGLLAAVTCNIVIFGT
jgi:hypothetical protein